jgi:hypothetical protein
MGNGISAFLFIYVLDCSLWRASPLPQCCISHYLWLSKWPTATEEGRKGVSSVAEEEEAIISLLPRPLKWFPGQGR